MATSNTIPVVIPQPIAAQATSENINVIPNGATGTNGASFQEGFPAITRMPVIENPLPTQVSGLPPKQQDFNGLFNVVSQHNFFAQNGGTYSFNQAVSDAIGGYAKNQILWYFPTNGLPVPVLSMIDNNTYNFAENPSYIDGEKWRYIVADTSLDNLSTTGQAKFDAKANVSNTVTTDTVQTITEKKTFDNSTASSRTDVYISSQVSNSYSWSGALVFQKGDFNTGFCESFLSGAATKDAVMQLTAHQNVGGTDYFANLVVGVRGSDGSKYALAPTPPDGANGEEIVTVKWARNFLNPTGTIIIWSAPTPPDGYLICNGAAVSRTTYERLFKVIGTTWGAGDGNTTFNLPNMLDYGPWYSGVFAVGKYSNGGLPNITGTFGSLNTSKTYSGAFADAGQAFLARYYYDTNAYGRIVSFDASRSSNVYGSAARIIPAFASCLFCIKY